MAEYTALVVEDEPAMIFMYEHLLSREGYRVYKALDGQTAMDLLAEISPDVVFLDMLLPRTNGLMVLQFIAQQAHLVHTRVVIVTSSLEMRQHISIIPGTQFIVKPIMPDQILAVAASIKQH